MIEEEGLSAAGPLYTRVVPYSYYWAMNSFRRFNLACVFSTIEDFGDEPQSRS